jgi:hypothetical protein
VVLIVAGLAMAGGAFFLLYSHRRGEGAPAEEIPEEPDAEPPQEPVDVQVSESEEPPAPQAETPPAAAPPRPEPPTGKPVAVTESPSGEPPMSQQPSPGTPPPENDPQLFPVVTLLRHDVTGELALQVGGRLYRKTEELKGSPDWNRVEYAARDLVRWLEGSPQPTRQPEPRREEAPAVGGSMIEQINRILEIKLTAQGGSSRGVRLAEAPGGGVRVYIGVQGYAIDEVPDPAIRSAIREAVAEWEASS